MTIEEYVENQKKLLDGFLEKMKKEYPDVANDNMDVYDWDDQFGAYVAVEEINNAT
jgi:hypothetical protein